MNLLGASIQTEYCALALIVFFLFVQSFGAEWLNLFVTKKCLIGQGALKHFLTLECLVLCEMKGGFIEAAHLV